MRASPYRFEADRHEIPASAIALAALQSRQSTMSQPQQKSEHNKTSARLAPIGPPGSLPLARHRAARIARLGLTVTILDAGRISLVIVRCGGGW